MASRLFALDGAEVAEVDEEPGGGPTVWLVTADPGARVCPVCKTASEHVREQVVTRPADIGYGWDQVSVVWVKRSGSAGLRPARAVRSPSRCRPSCRDAG
jgi:hypothetical protein